MNYLFDHTESASTCKKLADPEDTARIAHTELFASWVGRNDKKTKI